MNEVERVEAFDNNPWSHWIVDNCKMSEMELVQYFVKRDRLDSKSRGQDAVYKRFYLFTKLYYSREKQYTLQEIGNVFKRNHTTVIHGLNAFQSDKHSKRCIAAIMEYEVAFSMKNPFTVFNPLL